MNNIDVIRVVRHDACKEDRTADRNVGDGGGNTFRASANCIVDKSLAGSITRIVG